MPIRTTLFHLLSGVFASEIRRREAQASSLSDEIDRILYGEEHWNLDEYSEGELAILQDKVRKLVIRLRISDTNTPDNTSAEKRMQTAACQPHTNKTISAAAASILSAMINLWYSGLI